MAEQTPQEIAEAVRNAATDLIEQRADAPRKVRVRATEISVEITWDGETAVPARGPGVRNSAAPAPGPQSEPQAGPAAGASEEDPARQYVCSPSVGTFYRSPEPGAPPFADIGTVLTPGQQIGIVEVMKLMIPVEAADGGRVVEVLKGDAEPVEYGERLFAVLDGSAGS